MNSANEISPEQTAEDGGDKRVSPHASSSRFPEQNATFHHLNASFITGAF
jgi:hypothetical protein